MSGILEFLRGLFAPKGDLQFQPFASPEELAGFVLTDWTNFKLYQKDTHDCDDFAMQFQVEALKRGYLTSLYLTPDGKHMQNLAIIQNEMWIIEPQTDLFWRLGPLD